MGLWGPRPWWGPSLARAKAPGSQTTTEAAPSPQVGRPPSPDWSTCPAPALGHAAAWGLASDPSPPSSCAPSRPAAADCALPLLPTPQPPGSDPPTPHAGTGAPGGQPAAAADCALPLLAPSWASQPQRVREKPHVKAGVGLTPGLSLRGWTVPPAGTTAQGGPGGGLPALRARAHPRGRPRRAPQSPDQGRKSPVPPSFLTPGRETGRGGARRSEGATCLHETRAHG